MEKIKQYKYIILLVLVILGLSFYWFQLRPSKIRIDCWTKVKEVLNGKAVSSNEAEGMQNLCERGKGLNQ